MGLDRIDSIPDCSANGNPYSLEVGITFALGFECTAARETGPWIRTRTLSTRNCASYHQAKEADKDRIESCFSNSTRKAVTNKRKGEASEGIRTPNSLPEGENSTTELNALTAKRQL